MIAEKLHKRANQMMYIKAMFSHITMAPSGSGPWCGRAAKPSLIELDRI